MAIPASGPLSLTDIQTEFGGTNPIGLNEYYRGGPYVPTTGGSFTRQPASGQYYSAATPGTYVWAVITYPPASLNEIIANWNDTLPEPFPAAGVTSFVSNDGWTYFRGTFVTTTVGKLFTTNDYGIYREQGTTIAINTGVPSSGTISIANLYGAQNP
jgi:hypothetical protein